MEQKRLCASTRPRTRQILRTILAMHLFCEDIYTTVARLSSIQQGFFMYLPIGVGGGRCSVLAMVQQLLASTRVPLSCSRKRLPLAQSQGETAGMDTHIQGHRGGPGARESSGHLKLLEIADHVKDLAGPGRFAGRLEDKGAVGLPPQHEPFPLLAQLATLLS